MDVSSGCWPSDSTNSSTDQTNNNNGGGARCRKKSMNDSGKGSALSRHDEDYREDEGEFACDSLDPQINNLDSNQLAVEMKNKSSVDSQFKLQNYKDSHLNIRNQLKHPALYNLMLNKHNIINNNTLNTNSHSDTSRTSENLTQIFNINKSRAGTMTRSIQTSFASPKTTTMKENIIRVVPPSFLAKLNKEAKLDKAPVFVVYPNYSLPDLEFVKTQAQVILSPVGLKDSNCKLKRSRPVSLNDIDIIKRRQYGHVVDWKSLLTLLPQEYRKILKNIPEAYEANMNVSVQPQRPIFSMTPPIRQNRGVACDCAYILSNTNNNSSSSGGSSSQPQNSSGYRGSSTILTESDMGDEASKNNMYVYQYETEGPPVADRPPISLTPKGILRRANTARVRIKRSRMLDTDAALTQLEKRRSLQEPFLIQNNTGESNVAENEDVNSELRFIKHLLPNYPKQREVYEDHRKLRSNFDEMDFTKPGHLFTKREEREARQRAEQFLVSIPKSELKHYVEIANILDSDISADETYAYNPYQLRSEVSRVLSSQRKVSFIKNQSTATSPSKLRSPASQRLLKQNELRFTTPPNSPNISIMAAGIGVKKSTSQLKRDFEKEKQEKIQSNRFKRLQIQWELLSKDQRLETKSGGTTPTSAVPRSKIPRPVSYPSAR